MEPLSLVAGFGQSMMLEQMRQNPMSAMFGCVMMIPVAIWVISILHWMISGDLDVLAGILGIGLSIFLLILGIRPPVDWLSPLIFCGMIVLAIVLPFIRKSMNDRALRLIEIETLERHLSAVVERPDRMMSRIEAAARLVQFGLVGHAVGIASPVLQLPIRNMDQEKKLVQRWISMRNTQNGRIVPCLKCGANGNEEAILCPQCGAPYLAIYLRGGVHAGTLARKLILGWTLGVGMLLAIPAVAVTAPPAGALILIPMMIGIGGYSAYRTFFARAPDSF